MIWSFEVYEAGKLWSQLTLPVAEDQLGQNVGASQRGQMET